MTKVMRKEAWHSQRRDQASGVPLEILEHLPKKKKKRLFRQAISQTLFGTSSPALPPSYHLGKNALQLRSILHLLGIDKIFYLFHRNASSTQMQMVFPSGRKGTRHEHPSLLPNMVSCPKWQLFLKKTSLCGPIISSLVSESNLSLCEFQEEAAGMQVGSQRHLENWV